MNALVTGGAGFIGSSITRALLADGWRVRVLDNLLTGFEENIPDEAHFVRADLRDPEALPPTVAGVDVIFHQAALRSVPRSVDDPQLSASCNITGTLNLLMAAEQAGVKRVVYASSSSVYGDVAEGRQHEGMTPSPLSPYAVSKLAAEQYCRVWTHLKGLSTVSLRYFNVFGPGQRPESKYAAVFPAFIDALVHGRAPEVHWDGEQSRDFSYIDDVVRANIAAATAGPAADGAVINVAGGDPKSINQVLEAVSKAVGTWIEPERTPKRAGDIRRTHADISAAARLIGFVPQAAWIESVERTVAWFEQRRVAQSGAEAASETAATASSSGPSSSR
ncbi:MAG: NAD-dependent epimerase/dehydratase family protein [Actinomycetota bacterium]